jgi:hypothetical protein
MPRCHFFPLLRGTPTLASSKVRVRFRPNFGHCLIKNGFLDNAAPDDADPILCLDAHRALGSRPRNCRAPTNGRLSITHFKRLRVFRLHLSAIIDSGSGNISVAEPFLDLGNVRFMVERIRGGRCAKGVRADLEATWSARSAIGIGNSFHTLISRMAHCSRPAPDSTCPSGKVTSYPSSPSQGFKTESNPPWLVNFCSLGSRTPVVRNIQTFSCMAKPRSRRFIVWIAAVRLAPSKPLASSLLLCQSFR